MTQEGLGKTIGVPPGALIINRTSGDDNVDLTKGHLAQCFPNINMYKKDFPENLASYSVGL